MEPWLGLITRCGRRCTADWLIVGTMLGATLVWQGGPPSWLRNCLMVLALIVH